MADDEVATGRTRFAVLTITVKRCATDTALLGFVTTVGRAVGGSGMPGEGHQQAALIGNLSAVVREDIPRIKGRVHPG